LALQDIYGREVWGGGKTKTSAKKKGIFLFSPPQGPLRREGECRVSFSKNFQLERKGKILVKKKKKGLGGGGFVGAKEGRGGAAVVGCAGSRTRTSPRRAARKPEKELHKVHNPVEKELGWRRK